MRIWLTTIGEPVPIDGNGSDRLHRTGFLAHYLAENGYDVVWWTSTFDHFRKKHLFTTDKTIRVNERLEIELLHGGGYRNNLSLRRIFDHRRVASKFARKAPARRRPEIIFSAFPTIDLSMESVSYGRANRVPVVLDMRDMWPDIFIDAAPIAAPILKLFAKSLAAPMFRQTRFACERATAITGITEAFVDWGLERGSRTRTVMDRAFPMGYTSAAPDQGRIAAARKYWDNLGVTAATETMKVCFIGTLGRQFDLDSVIHAARKIGPAGRKILFVICGTGEHLQRYKRMATDNPSVIFPGWIDAAQIYVLMRRCCVGLDPLPDRYDFLATINNKAIEYMSAGLPVISSPERGVLGDLLRKHRCGASYPCGDAGALADILARFHDDPRALRNMSEKSARLFQTMFTAEKVYGDLMDHLTKIVENEWGR